MYVIVLATRVISELLIINITLATRMATVGRIEEFNPEKERISTYLERIDLFFVGNEVEEAKQVATLLSVIGGKTYALLSDLLAPDKPEDKPASKTLKQLKKTLQTHFEPKLPLLLRNIFSSIEEAKKLGESVAEYEAELRRLAANCKFGDHLTQAIRDCLVCGLRSEGTQKRLLAEADLTLAKALEIAQSMEAANRNTQRLKGSSEPQRISDIRRDNTHGSGSKPMLSMWQ